MEDKDFGSKGRKWWYILTAVFAAVLVVSMVNLGRTLWDARRENADFEKLAELAAVVPEESAVQAESPETAGAGDGAEGKDARPQRDYQGLYDLNPDFVGWLCIEGTKVDYPVMHTPKDQQYYIYRDFYGKKTASGTPFMGADCTTESDSIIIYGHNMKNGTMFGTLDEYRDKGYWEEHPVIWFDTLEGNRDYEIFAVFSTRLLYENEDGFRYYGYTGDLTEEEFAEFVGQAGKMSHYDTGIIPEYGDQLLILSTCSYHTENGRLVVVGRRSRTKE